MMPPLRRTAHQCLLLVACTLDHSTLIQAFTVPGRTSPVSPPPHRLLSPPEILAAVGRPPTQLAAAPSNSDDADGSSSGDKKGSSRSPRAGSSDDATKGGGQGKKRKPYYGRNRPKKKIDPTKPQGKQPQPLTKEEKKKIVAQAAKTLRGETAAKSGGRGRNENNGNGKGGDGRDEEESILDIVNPFKAGKKLRETLESLTGMTREARAVYLDDRFGGGPGMAERNPGLQRQSDCVPEVLVVGATGEVGRLVVRRLLLEGSVRVRVLVRDLYSKTLNMLGAGVTYCQGDLGNYESLEYAVTDVDKIVFCAGAPRPDEPDFQEKFREFMRENLSAPSGSASGMGDGTVASGRKAVDGDSNGVAATKDVDWEQVESVLQLRAQLAEQIDFVGMQNVVRAYQNVRFADYGASQTAKRSLFKFGSKNEDFDLFAIDESEELVEDPDRDKYDYDEDALLAEEEAYYDSMTDQYDLVDGEEYTSTVQLRQGGVLTKTQCLWMRNKFNHAVFVGKVSDLIPGGEAAVISSRLRSRDDPENGIDLSSGFGGFVLRVCSDGGTYEAFVRTDLYETDGIEYVCEFATEAKAAQQQEEGSGNKSRNRFTTVRLGFENFKPVQREGGPGDHHHPPLRAERVPQFRGRDMRTLGFRYRADANDKKLRKNRFFVKNKEDLDKYSQFYLAFDYIKVYRAQPEPEFVYLSDARIPPKVSRGMVRHDRKQIRATRDGDGDDDDDDYSTVLLKDADVVSAALERRSREETYFKYRGEEVLKGSGLSYAIVRVLGFNEVSAGESSTIQLRASNRGGDLLVPVSRSDVADVCVRALADPNALNKSFYVSKSSRAATAQDENMSLKFAALPIDA